MRLLVMVVLGLVLVAGVCSDVLANGTISEDWKDTYLLQTCSELVMAANDCSLCHTTVPSLNDYGQDMADAKDDPGFATWAGAMIHIEPFDSDGDNRTNIQEIEDDCTLPGDASSVVANEENSWGIIKKVFESRGIDL